MRNVLDKQSSGEGIVGSSSDYLAASPQAGGCGDVDYGYDAGVSLRGHLGLLGRHKEMHL